MANISCESNQLSVDQKAEEYACYYNWVYISQKYSDVETARSWLIREEMKLFANKASLFASYDLVNECDQKQFMVIVLNKIMECRDIVDVLIDDEDITLL